MWNTADVKWTTIKFIIAHPFLFRKFSTRNVDKKFRVERSEKMWIVKKEAREGFL